MSAFPADPGVETEPFGWLCNMTVLRLPAAQGGGCVLYSPILDEDNRVDGVLRELEARDLLPVRIVLAPSPQHHLALTAYQEAVPDAASLEQGSGRPKIVLGRPILVRGFSPGDLSRSVGTSPAPRPRPGSRA